LTGRFLYEPVTYRAGGGSWTGEYLQAVRRCPQAPTWDPAAVLSILSFNYVCGDRTLFREIARKPWLSGVGADGRAELLEIPPHGRKSRAAGEVAAALERLLVEEVAEACRGRSRVFVLLSGGLDSRVATGVVARAVAEGRIRAPVTALTWGLPDCRDVAYARQVARILGLEWRHVPLGPEHLLENLDHAAVGCAALVSPVHLHRMAWFRDVEPDALVVAASYGDSIGRAEFSGTHLLELEELEPADPLGLMTDAALAAGRGALREELEALRRRCADRPRYGVRECEMHCHYTRGLLAHAMNLVNRFCGVCQLFTHPSVYEYVWSIHPAMRTDEVYARLLDRLHPELPGVPWARTGRPLRGRRRSRGHLRRRFHDYEAWIMGPLAEPLGGLVEPEWFAATGIFRAEAVADLQESVRQGRAGKSQCQVYAWLASVRRLAQAAADSGRAPAPFRAEPLEAAAAPPTRAGGPLRRARKWLGRNRLLTCLHARLRPARKYLLRRRALRLYPPETP